MKTLQQLFRYEKLHNLIEGEHTGTPEELAEKLKISRRTLYEMLNYLKDIGAAIRYSRVLTTFFYTKKFQIKIDVSVVVLSDEEERKVFGGQFFMNEMSSNTVFF